MVEIYITQFSEKLDTARFSLCVKSLPLSLRNRAHSFLRWQDAHAYVIGKLLLQLALNRYHGIVNALERIQYSSFKRPLIDGLKGDFNISHSGECVVCAVSNGGAIGVDVEKINMVDPDEFSQVFTEYELAEIKGSENVLLTFYSLWTKKEAIVKADGRGMFAPLQEIETFAGNGSACLEGKWWHVRDVDVGPGHRCSIASDIPLADGEISICKIDLQTLMV